MHSLCILVNEYSVASHQILTIRKPLSRKVTDQSGKSHDLICLALIRNNMHSITQLLRRPGGGDVAQLVRAWVCDHGYRGANSSHGYNIFAVL